MSDVAIKGSIGVFLYGLFGVSPWIVIAASTLMWLSNHIIPAVAGSLVMWKSPPSLKLNKA